MCSKIFRGMVVCGLMVAGLAVLGATYRPATAQVPDPNPSGPVVYWIGPLTITPPAPPVGTNYIVTGMVHSRHNRPLMIRATIMPPPLDLAQDPVQTRRIEANGDMGFQWTVYCGESGGMVNVKIDIVREL